MQNVCVPESEVRTYLHAHDIKRTTRRNDIKKKDPTTCINRSWVEALAQEAHSWRDHHGKRKAL
jgi:hypothetical protein